MKPTDGQVERVAEAVRRTRFDRMGIVIHYEPGKCSENDLDDARAAISAMPEPTVTVGMVTAALSAVGEHEVSLSSYRRVEVTKMILAALAWRPSPPQKDEQP